MTSKSPPQYPRTVASVAGEPVLTPLKRASMPLPSRMKRKKLRDFWTARADFFRRFAAARVEALAKRQKVQDEVGKNAGASADVAAIIENLALQFFDKRSLRFFQLPVMSGDCEIGENERDETDDARNAVGRVSPCRLQRDDLLADALT